MSTVRVHFSNDFFVKGYLFRKGQTHDVPEHLVKVLPKTAKRLDQPTPGELTPQQKAAKTRAENKAREQAEAAAKAKDAGATDGNEGSGAPKQKAAAS